MALIFLTKACGSCPILLPPIFHDSLLLRHMASLRQSEASTDHSFLEINGSSVVRSFIIFLGRNDRPTLMKNMMRIMFGSNSVAVNRPGRIKTYIEVTKTQYQPLEPPPSFPPAPPSRRSPGASTPWPAPRLACQGPSLQGFQQPPATSQPTPA